MSIFTEHANAMAEEELEREQYATIAGTECACFIRLTRKGNDPTEGGTWVTAVGSLTVRRSLLPSIPKEGAAIVVSGVSYTAITVGDQENIPFVQIQFGKVPKP